MKEDLTTTELLFADVGFVGIQAQYISYARSQIRTLALYCFYAGRWVTRVLLVAVLHIVVLLI